MLISRLNKLNFIPFSLEILKHVGIKLLLVADKLYKRKKTGWQCLANH